MTTFGELKGQILRLLGDPDSEGYSPELLIDAVQAAQIAILPWMPKTASVQLASGDTEYALPNGFYAVEAVIVDSTGEVLPQAIFAPGNYFGAKISGTNDWIEFPAGYISFSKELPETYTLYYLATWAELDDTTTEEYELEVPIQATVGMCLYGAAYALQPQAVGTAAIRQFATKVDSGNPEHNPLQQSATYLLKLFVNEMNRHPKYQRSQR
jgi:hypothetical protein